MLSSDGEAIAAKATPLPHSLSGEGNGSGRNIAHLISAWWPVAIGIAIIALESTEMMGSDHTSHPLRWLFELLFGHVPDTRWNLIHHYIRKSGHFVGYGLLCLTWLRAWLLSVPRFCFVQVAALAILSTAIVACCDEWHQLFLPNRTSSPLDVLLDCCGAVTTTFLTSLIQRLCKPGLLSK